jgi:hypothetical protein
LRKLRDAYAGSATRVRRTNLAEQNIGFNSTNGLDTVALSSFVGTGALDNGFMTTFYDQANSNNATQSSLTNQPSLVSAGSIVTSGGLPAIQGGSSLGVRTGALPLSSSNIIWFFLVVDISNVVLTQILFESSSNFNNNNGAFICYIQSNTVTVGQKNGSGLFSTKSYPITNGRKLISGYIQTGQTAANGSKLFVNGSEVTGTVTTNNSTSSFVNQVFCLMARNGNTLGFRGKTQGMVFYLSDQSSNRLGIEQNINEYYGIY